jgi:hypothetical protein
MPLTAFDPGCCCTPTPTPPPCSTTICVQGCGGQYQPNATVTIKSGSTVIATGTTDATGCVTLSIPAAGSYTVIVVLAGFSTSTSTLTLGCGGLQIIALTLADAWTCFCTGTGNCPSWPFGTVKINDGQGSVTCTYGSTFGGAVQGYIGCATRTMMNPALYSTWAGTSCGLPNGTSMITTPLIFTLQCVNVGTPSYLVVVYAPFCSGGPFTWMDNADCSGNPPQTSMFWWDNIDSGGDLVSQSLGGCGASLLYTESHAFTSLLLGYPIWGSSVTFTVTTP